MCHEDRARLEEDYEALGNAVQLNAQVVPVDLRRARLDYAVS